MYIYFLIFHNGFIWLKSNLPVCLYSNHPGSLTSNQLVIKVILLGFCALVYSSDVDNMADRKKGRKRKEVIICIFLKSPV